MIARYFLCLLMPPAALLAQRPPAVPLVTNDPYFSIWSTADQLTAETTRHWTGTPQSLTSYVRIDGKTYRLMGAEQNDKLPALPQISLAVHPTQTIYIFQGAGISVTLTFTSPLLPHDLDVLSWPLTYLTWTAKSSDAGAHDVQLYFDAAADIAVNTADQPVNWSRLQTNGLRALRAGTREQPVLQKTGDNLRIDWGYFYVATPPSEDVRQAVNDRAIPREDFQNSGEIRQEDSFAEHNPRVRYNSVPHPVLAVSFHLGSVGAQPVSRYVMLAYDDLYSLEYFNRRVRPYWRRNGAGAADMLHAAAAVIEHDRRKMQTL